MNTRGSGFGGRGSDRSPLRVPSPEPRTPNRLPRQVKLFGWVSLLNDFASEMIYPLLPAFVTGVLGGGPQALGALDGAAEFAAAVVKLGAGRLADRRLVAARVGERGAANGDWGEHCAGRVGAVAGE